MIEYVKKLYNEKIAEEKRNFMIAYGELKEEYHGYLEGYPNNVRIWSKSLEEGEFKELKKDCPRVWQSTKGVFVKVVRPYMSLDGILAMANDDHDKENSYSVEHEVVHVVDAIWLIKAVVNSTKYGTRTAFAKVDQDISTREDKGLEGLDFDKATSTATRKALNYLGYGRFPIKATDYGEDKTVKEFREFKIGKK